MRLAQPGLKKSGLSADMGSPKLCCKTNPNKPVSTLCRAMRLRRIHMSAIDVRRCGERRHPASRPLAADLLAEAARRVLHTLHTWRERIRARNELARLDHRVLADIGLNPADRDFLVNKPFWRE